MVKLIKSVGTYPVGSEVSFSPQAESDLVASGKAAYMRAATPHIAAPAAPATTAGQTGLNSSLEKE